MLIYPAIDLKDGKWVRLFKGEMTQSTIFNHNPKAQATEFEEKGCKWLHIVDLDGAISTKSNNSSVIKEIIKSFKGSIQVGGGVRTFNEIEKWLNSGVKRVILGTLATKNPGFVKEAAQKFPGQIIVGLDARNDRVAIEGWRKTTKFSVIDLARKYEDSGVAAIIYTDISKDGTLEGPNVEATESLAVAISIPVIASGGVASLKDLIQLKKCKGNLDGVICGRALYENKINLSEAIFELGNLC
mgnify:CR=1 FL=1